MKAAEDHVRAGLVGHLARLWRYGLVLSRRRDVAEDLVQATREHAFLVIGRRSADGTRAVATRLRTALAI